ncbi:hypothetical protein [Peptacetobacter hiranonis]|uniref:Uncharacterized protein n=1 Tax=Peptacetobacter hiranonis (strain DSM 13275 / JCM 10541 / KCTC 15199 / TO-931) TaxID=500633 RepID=B6G013_PEPHT|nr:hypothetical protein [Peptacetobacter hiranonis]EEA84841.1 hypothetical protein CLOHIR_01467 [Peptacetobacter hiranonis DSM 13275]QEK20753.1 hypothetical protein KGNDJEFE_01240 [Peptacetobacter hiranonis]
MATKTKTIGLNQYVGSDYVKMADFNADNLAIDNAFKEDRAKMKEIEDNVNGMELVDSKIRITDAQSHFTGETLDKVLDELKTDVSSIETTASGTSYTDTHTLGATDVQKAIDALATKVKALETKTQTLEQELTGQVTKLSGINTELETEIGNPV